MFNLSTKNAIKSNMRVRHIDVNIAFSYGVPKRASISKRINLVFKSKFYKF